MSYEAQLKFKQKFVSDALIRIGKLDIPEILPISKIANLIFTEIN
jgi:tRNA/tmRNA/rRNA uracil-C5-methylase (TrmA/RlmC/RlmD family)